ncbi:MAG: protoporphyrinogen oxidase [Planctomycetota bacterium]|jgi:oxygen-dependent protoporphyrinogen oxidase
MTKRIAVIGGGIGGLATAWYLCRRDPDCEVVVYEAAEQVGGVIATVRRDGWVLEEGPDSIISAKPEGMALLRELGLADDVQGTKPEAAQAFIVRKRRLVPVPKGLYLLAPGRWWPFVWTKLVSWPAKLRMGLDLFLPRRPADAPEESLAQFVRRRLGSEALNRIAQPMVGGIYTADPEKLSLAATMPQFIDMEREHRSLLLAMRRRAKAAKAAGRGEGASGPRYGLFVSLPGGLATLIERLVDCLRGERCRIETAASVTALAPVADGRWRITTEAAGMVDYDAVTVALPGGPAARLLAGFDAEMAAALAAVPYAGVATVSLGYRADQVARLPQGAGFVVPAIEHRLILACTVVSTKYAGRAPEGQVLLRAFVGGGMFEEDLKRGDDDLVAAVHAELAELLAIDGEPGVVHVRRWDQVMAQHVVGHRERVATLRGREAEWPGLALVGNSYEGVGIPDIIAQSSAAATRLGAVAESRG